MRIFILDGLRGIANLFVVFYHFYPTLIHNGFLGVDIFFILSGYLINYSQSHNYNKGILTFLFRRIKRIFPLKVAIVYSITLINCYKRKEDFYMLYKEEKYAFLLLSNYYFLNLKKDYFQSQDINLLLHFWSLSVEEQFYLYYSCFYIFIDSKYNIFHTSKAVVNSSFFIFSLIYFIRFYNSDFNISFYSLISRLWEFGMGISLFIFYDKNYKIINNDIIVLLIVFIVLNKNIYYRFHILLIFFCSIVITSTNNSGYILSSSSLNYIGRISYSLYLVHYPVGIFFDSYKLFMSFIMSIILYYGIESNKFVLYIKGNVILIIYVILFILNYSLYNYISMNNYISYKVNYHSIFISDMCSFDFISHVENYKTNILLFGDSHILHYIRALYDPEKKIVLYFYCFNSINVYKNNIIIPSSFLKLKFNIVLICFSHLYFISNYSLYQNNINHLLNHISNISTLFLLIMDNPRMKFNPNLFLNSNNSYGIENINCSVVRNHEILNKYNNNIKVYKYTLNKFVMHNKTCLIKTEYIPIYMDCNHLNPLFIENYIKKDLQKNIEIILKRKLWKINTLQKEIKYYTFYLSGNIYLQTCINNKKPVNKIKKIKDTIVRKRMNNILFLDK